MARSNNKLAQIVIVLAAIWLIVGCPVASLARTFYESPPPFHVALQVYSNGSWGSEAHIRAGESVSYRIIDPTTGQAPADYDTKVVQYWDCILGEWFEERTLIPDGLSYSYNFGDGNNSGDPGGSHQYDLPTTYTITCTVEDTGGHAGQHDGPQTVSATVVVEQDPTKYLADPPIRASAVQSLSDTGPWQGLTLDVAVGQTVFFSGDSTDAPSYDQDLDSNANPVNDAITTYNWDFGDGSPVEGGANTSHAYASPGCYVISLTADDAGYPFSLFDDPISEPDELQVRVFQAAPAIPTVTEPDMSVPYCSLTPIIEWTAEIHDVYQVKVSTIDDPEAEVLWGSGEMPVEGSDYDCTSNSQEGKIVCGTTLEEGLTYYAFVRVHNVLGWSPWSAQGHAFSVLVDNNPPENISVNPSSGNFSTGAPASLFSASYSDYCRYVNIARAEFLIDDSTLDKTSACYLVYDQNTNLCWLADDGGTVWTGGFEPQSANILENFSVVVGLQNTSVSADGANLTVTWSIQFKDSFVGAKMLALSISNDQGRQDPDNFQIFGNIDVGQSSGPNSVITYPINGQYLTAKPITITGTASDPSGLTQIEISTDTGETWNVATGTTSWSYIWDGMEDGRYLLKSRATNAASPEITEIPGSGVNVIIDTVPPFSEILEPLDNANLVGDSITVSGSAFDSTSGIAKVEVSFDDGATWFDASGSDFFTYTYSITESGTFQIRTRATDKAGLVETPGPGISVTVEYQEQRQLLSGETQSPGPDIQRNIFEAQKTLQVGPYSIVNLATGNMLTTIPIVGWDSMGDLGIEFTMYHQNRRPSRPDDGTSPKWMHSYQSILTQENPEEVVIYQPDGSGQSWKKTGTTWTRNWGNNDDLTELGTGQGFVVTKKDQVKVYYTQPGTRSTTWLPRYIEQPTGQRVSLSYNAAKLLEWIRDPDGKRWIYVYWKEMSDHKKGVWCVYSSAKFGANYQRYWFRTTSEGVLTGIQFPPPQAGDLPYVPYLGKEISFAFDGEGQFRQITAPGSGIWQYEYDRGHAVTVVNPNNQRTYFLYVNDFDPYMPPVVGPYSVATIVKDLLGRETGYQHLDPSRATYSLAGTYGCDRWIGMRAYCVARASLTGQKQFEYYNWFASNNNLKWYKDYRGVTTQFTWDGRANLLTRKIAGETTTMTYTTPGSRLETVSEPSGRFARYTYHPTYQYLTKKQVDPNNWNITTDFGHDTYANLTSEIGPRQNGETTPPATIFEFADQFKSCVTKTVDEAGYQVVTSNDSLGNKLVQSLPRKVSTDPLAADKWNYDKMGRPFYVWHSGDTVLGDTSSTIEYWPDGKPKLKLDENGHRSTYDYDHFGNLVFEQHEESEGHWIATSYVYDAVGRLKEVWVGNNPGTLSKKTEYAYDDFDRLTKVTANGVTTKYAYQLVPLLFGKLSLVLTRTDPSGNLTRTTYNDLNLISSRQYFLVGGSTKSVQFYYFPGGKLQAIRDWTMNGAITRQYTYDTAGRLAEEVCNDLSVRIHYEYTGASQKKTVQIRDMSGNPLATYNYHYTLDGKLDYVQDPNGGYTRFEYDFRGRVNKKTLPNGTYTTYAYNDLAGPSGYNNSSNTLSNLRQYQADDSLIYQGSYAYYKDGNLRTANDGISNTTYQYDWLYRLNSEIRTSSTPYNYAYTYDANGSRLTKTVSGTTYYYHYDTSGRLADYGINNAPPYTGNTFLDYDLNGNVWRKRAPSSTTTYLYDPDNNLTTASLPSGTDTFKYNGTGQRVETTDSRGTRRYLCAGEALLRELDPSGAVLAWYNPGISQTVGSTITYFHHDRLGTTVRLTSVGGLDTGNRWVFDSWGNMLSQTGGIDTRYKFVGAAGYYSDPDTSLLKLGVRYYDPAVGRFITLDPARDGTNWYAYAEGNPVNAIDPTGEDPSGFIGYPGYGGYIDPGYTAAAARSMQPFWDEILDDPDFFSIQAGLGAEFLGGTIALTKTKYDTYLGVGPAVSASPLFSLSITLGQLDRDLSRSEMDEWVKGWSYSTGGGFGLGQQTTTSDIHGGKDWVTALEWGAFTPQISAAAYTSQPLRNWPRLLGEFFSAAFYFGPDPSAR